MPCALLGDRASGKTTFLGLLYSAQVKYGTGVQDDFRFHAPIQSLNIMSAVYEGMKDGRFPSATLKEEITELGFVFGYLRKVVGKLPYYIRQQNWVHPFSTLRFSAYDVSGEDIEEFIETGIASRPLIQQLLKSVVVCVLVDCSKMTTEIDTPAYKKMLRYDSTVAKLLVSFQTYKKQEYDRLKTRASGPSLQRSTPFSSCLNLTRFGMTSSRDWACTAGSRITTAPGRNTPRRCSASSCRRRSPRSAAARSPGSAWTSPRISSAGSEPRPTKAWTRSGSRRSCGPVSLPRAAGNPISRTMNTSISSSTSEISRTRSPTRSSRRSDSRLRSWLGRPSRLDHGARGIRPRGNGRRRRRIRSLDLRRRLGRRLYDESRVPWARRGPVRSVPPWTLHPDPRGGRANGGGRSRSTHDSPSPHRPRAPPVADQPRDSRRGGATDLHEPHRHRADRCDPVRPDHTRGRVSIGEGVRPESRPRRSRGASAQGPCPSRGRRAIAFWKRNPQASYFPRNRKPCDSHNDGSEQSHPAPLPEHDGRSPKGHAQPGVRTPGLGVWTPAHDRHQ